MIIGTDLDDTLLNFADPLHAFHNAKYGTNILPKDNKTYHLEKTWDCSVEEVMRRIDEFFLTKEHAESVPVQGAVEAITELSKENTLYVITAKPSRLELMTLDWIDKYFPKLFKQLHLTNQFDSSNGAKKKKSVLCQELGIEYFVEDSVHHANDVADVVKKVFLLNYPWNLSETDLKPNVMRVDSWAEIVEQLKGEK